MRDRTRFRFSLRTLLLLVAAAALASLWYRSHREFQRSPSKTDSGGGYRIDGDPQHLRTRIYRDHNDRLVAILLLTFDELDVYGPQYRLEHGYNARDGGWLRLDGLLIQPASIPRVFVNNPLGHIVEIDLTANQAEDLARRRSAAQIEAFYRQSIEPLFLRCEGSSDAKGRQGQWSFRLLSGELYRQVSYADGLRHGESQVYYQDGVVKCQGSFQHGRPVGEWTLFDPDGDVLAVIDRWGGDRWLSLIDDKNGYRLFADGTELRMPP